MNTLLSVRNLNVSFALPDERILAVRDVSFDLGEGKTLGLVGESGCGKSVTAFSILRLIPRPGSIDGGEILYRGRDILAMGDEELRRVRGKQIAMIFQEPMTSLNPVFTIGYQIEESILTHLPMGKREAREYAAELLAQVGIPDPARRLAAYPHEFSGGMRQRAMIAMALAASPSVLIADEPTTALDVTIQAQILDLLLSLQQEKKMSLLLITHDLGVVANIADEIAIMYAGEIVEFGKTTDIFDNPCHPYTWGLFEAIPRIGGSDALLKTIPGMVPSVRETPTGCVFHPRCPVGTDACLEGPVAFVEGERGHYVRCIHCGKKAAGSKKGSGARVAAKRAR